MTIVQAVLLVVLLAALIRMPGPRGDPLEFVLFLLAIAALLYVLLVRRLV